MHGSHHRPPGSPRFADPPPLRNPPPGPDVTDAPRASSRFRRHPNGPGPADRHRTRVQRPLGGPEEHLEAIPLVRSSQGPGRTATRLSMPDRGSCPDPDRITAGPRLGRLRSADRRRTGNGESIRTSSRYPQDPGGHGPAGWLATRRNRWRDPTRRPRSVTPKPIDRRRGRCAGLGAVRAAPAWTPPPDAPHHRANAPKKWGAGSRGIRTKLPASGRKGTRVSIADRWTRP